MAWLRRGKSIVFSVLLLALLLVPITESPLLLTRSTEFHRIVVLSDLHLPYRPEIKDPEKQKKIVEAKNKVIEDINAWGDVSQIAVIGDIAAAFGTEREMAYAAQYFSRFNKPLSMILGNHDYIYEDTLSPFGRRVRAETTLRERKIDRFKKTFELSEVFYSQKVGRFLLVFLSADSLESRYLTQISARQLKWLQKELAKNTVRPTIIFFHAPLKGTVSNYSENANSPDFIAQPERPIEDIIKSNPQIFLWVSGHNHTPATHRDFASPINVWNGQVTNIHNADMDRETIWTNSLYLYPDKVMIKTFDHSQGNWLNELERTVLLPALK